MNTAETIAAAIAKGKAELTIWAAEGDIPRDVGSFSDLHNYLDANGIGGCFDIWADNDDIDVAAAIIGEVWAGLDTWIKTGALMAAA